VSFSNDKTNRQQNLKKQLSSPHPPGNVAAQYTHFVFRRHFAEPAPQEIYASQVTHEYDT